MPFRLLSAIAAVLLLSSTALARSSPTPASQARSFPTPPLRAWAATVIDADTGNVLYSVNGGVHLAIASTTKVMTAVLALELGKLDDRITVPKNAFNFESDATVMGLKPGQKVTLRDLLYGLMLPSGADAANTIAIHYAGSEKAFVALMNKKAAVLGMRNTHYGSAHGLDTPGQYSSSDDLARLGLYAAAMPDLMTIASARTYTWNGQTLVNANHVLFWYPNVDGIKPGYTNAAGICQLLDAQRHDRHVIVAILHTPDLVIDARNLLNFGLNDFSWAQSTLPGDGPSLTETGYDKQGAYVYFPSTGHYVRGHFWQAYLSYGRATSLGFPRTEPLTEGKNLVQYFQNGALSQDASGKVTRRALGGKPLPALPPTAVPSPTAREGTVVVGPSATPVRRGTPTPAPRPAGTPTAGPTPTATPVSRVDRVFATFLKAHKELGLPTTTSWKVGDYTLQLFQYGALAHSTHVKTTWRLPLADRFLAAKHYLPAYAGNVYPPGFAPRSVLTAIHWLQ